MRIIAMRVACNDEFEQDLVDALLQWGDESESALSTFIERRSPTKDDEYVFEFLFAPFVVGDKVNWPDEATQTDWPGTVTSVKGETTVTVKLDAGGTHEVPRAELVLIQHTPLQAIKRKES